MSSAVRRAASRVSHEAGRSVENGHSDAAGLGDAAPGSAQLSFGLNPSELARPAPAAPGPPKAAAPAPSSFPPPPRPPIAAPSAVVGTRSAGATVHMTSPGLAPLGGPGSMYSSPPAGLSMPNSMFAHGPMVGPGAMAPIGPPQVAALPAGRAVPMPGGAPGDNLYGQAPAMTLAPQPPAAAGGGPPGFKPLWKPPLVNEPLIWVKGGDPVPPFAVYSRADSVKLVVSIGSAGKPPAEMAPLSLKFLPEPAPPSPGGSAPPPVWSPTTSSTGPN